MKNLIVGITTLILLISFISTINAQNYWKGGTIGKETDWNTAKNWSQNRIPDWTQNVIIPDVSTQSGYFPVIRNAVTSISHLAIYSNAVLTILPEGFLRIDGSVTYNSGIYLGGKIISKGELIIANTALMEVDQQGGQLIFENKRLAKNVYPCCENANYMNAKLVEESKVYLDRFYSRSMMGW